MKNIITILLVTITLSNFSQEIKFGKVSKEELEEKFYPTDSTANAAYLFKKRRTFYIYSSEDGFEVVTEVHERIKIYNKDGFEKATKLVRFYKPESGGKEKVTSIKGYTFNIENGDVKKQKLSKKGIFEEKLSKYRSVKKISFPDIKVGSVIDLKYRLTSPYARSIDDVDYQFDIPVKNYLTKIEIPEYYTFKTKFIGYYIINPKITKKNGKISYFNGRASNNNIEFTTNITTYKAENIPALKDNEPFVNNIDNYRGGVKFELSYTKFPNSTPEFLSTTWEDVSKNANRIDTFGDELNKTGYYKKELPNVISAATSDIEKAITIFQFVKSKVKWNNYYGFTTDAGVKKAYKNGVGNVADINLMLTSMLRKAGLNANPVLVSTRNNGIPFFPTLNGFNYVITSVTFPDNSYMLLDATEPYSLPNILPERVLNWRGRKINKNGSSSWINLESNKISKEENNVTVKLLEDGSTTGLLRSKYDNLNALKFRNAYNHISNDDLISKLENRYSIEIENYRVSNKTDISKPVSQLAKFSSEDLVEQINGKLYINPLLFFSQTQNPFKSEERKFPVEFGSPWQDKNTISIQIPEGYKIESVPEAIAIGLPEKLGFFKFQAIPAGNKVKVQAILQFNTAIIQQQYYPALKDFYGKVVKKQLEKIVLTK